MTYRITLVLLFEAVMIAPDFSLRQTYRMRGYMPSMPPALQATKPYPGSSAQITRKLRFQKQRAR